MNNKLIAFADEFGTNSFDFETQSTHFIVASVICRESNLNSVFEGIDAIRAKHGFQKGEIKSSGVGSNHARRIKILVDIAKLNISVYAVIIDKRKLTGQGFSFKRSFYKYVNNLLYKEIYRTFKYIDLYVDEHGGNDYMMEFKRYIASQHPRNLFSDSDFTIANSKNSRGIQLADFIAGTLGYIFDEHKKSAKSSAYMAIMRPIISGLNEFPRSFSYEELKETNVDKSFDSRIAETCYLRVTDFLERESPDDQQTADQIGFLKVLQFLQRASLVNRYISTKEIISHMNPSRPEPLNEEYFRTKVVGSLRDRGIIIASGPKGYKIPTSIKDLASFINQGKRVVLPILSRIKNAREAIKLATGNELDILGDDVFSELKELADK